MYKNATSKANNLTTTVMVNPYPLITQCIAASK